MRYSLCFPPLVIREQKQQCSQLHDKLEGEGRKSGNFSCKVSIFVLLVEKSFCLWLR